MKNVLNVLATLTVCLAAPAFAWGPEGHTVIARVAVTELSPLAAGDLQWIISVGVPALNARMPGGKCQIDPADPWGPVPDYVTDHDVHTNLANWPDCWRFLTPATAPWHFDDIPLGDTPSGPLNAASQSWCASGCVSTALADNLRKLASSPTAPADAAMALAFVVHFVGDMHQPLHAEDNNDLGGNQVTTITTGSGVSASNLHSLWDTPLVAAAFGSDLDAATMKAANDDASPSGDWTTGADTVEGVIAVSDQWAEDAHALAPAAYSLLNIPVGAGATSNIQVTATYVQQEEQVVEGQIDRAAVRLAAALNAALTWSTAPVAIVKPQAGGYLNLAPLGYSAPPEPTDPLALELDLVQVRAARPAPTAIQWQEAVSDANAYNAEDIVRRFDDASGALLYEANRPLLVSMLRKVISDTGAYAGQAKVNNPRPRPYVEDPTIIACNLKFLAGTEQQSYPSGHAMNGYVVGLVLSQVFRDQRQAILARGVRYGDNRVACGVHHPSDVEAGRLLGVAYFNKLSADPTFQADLKCAQAEQAFAASATPLPTGCATTQKIELKALSSRKAPTPSSANLF